LISFLFVTNHFPKNLTETITHDALIDLDAVSSYATTGYNPILKIIQQMNQEDSHMRKLIPIISVLMILSMNLYAQPQKMTIAVMDFSNESGQYQLAYLQRTLSENIITTFAGSKNFTVVERFRLNEMLNEMKLAQAGIVNEKTAVEIGQALGADAIILGSYTAFGNNVQINARLINVETVQIITAKRYTGTYIPLLIDEVAIQLLIEMTPDEQEKAALVNQLQMRENTFKSRLRSPILAVAGGLTIPILGHAYVGGTFNLVRGAIYTVADIVYIIGIANTINDEDDDAYFFMLYLLMGTNLVSGVDAGISAAAHNSKLQKQGFTLQIKPDPVRRGVQVGLAYRF
jgi:TolB-like protein